MNYLQTFRQTTKTIYPEISRELVDMVFNFYFDQESISSVEEMKEQVDMYVSKGFNAFETFMAIGLVFDINDEKLTRQFILQNYDNFKSISKHINYKTTMFFDQVGMRKITDDIMVAISITVMYNMVITYSIAMNKRLK